MERPVRQDWPAPRRNREPILQALRTRVAGMRSMLEVASGTGQHAVHFARHLPAIDWQPTEVDPELFDSIEAWRAWAELPNLRRPLRLDVLESDWPVGRFDAIYSANLIHIAPWAVACRLLEHGPRHLFPGGSLFLYGPYFVTGEEPAPGNVSFDSSLRARDPRFGVRVLGDVEREATRRGLTLCEQISLPANNLLLWFRLESDALSSKATEPV